MGPPIDYLSYKDVIERVGRVVCRRHRLDADEADDFCSHCHVRFLENDFRLIRSFEGRSSFKSYVAVVVTRLYQDWRNAKWGKWRGSVEATRLGPVALQLEVLVVRDGRSLDEAEEILRTNRGVDVSRRELETMAARFPTRWPRRTVGDDELSDRAAPDVSPDELIQRRDGEVAAGRVVPALKRALGQLPPDDRLLLRLLFQASLTVAEVARMMRLEQKSLYRRRERLLLDLRRALRDQGIEDRDGVATLNAVILPPVFERDEAIANIPGGVRPYERGDGGPGQLAGAE